MKICTHCNKPVTLVPSAVERARKFGGRASDYTKLFPRHAACELAIRSADTTRLIRAQYRA